MPNTACIPLLKEDNNAEAVHNKAGIPIHPALLLIINNDSISCTTKVAILEPLCPAGRNVDKKILSEGKKVEGLISFPTIKRATNSNGNKHSKALKAIPAEIKKKCLAAISSKNS